jgi:hypothetical protein
MNPISVGFERKSTIKPNLRSEIITNPNVSGKGNICPSF